MRIANSSDLFFFFVSILGVRGGVFFSFSFYLQASCTPPTCSEDALVNLLFFLSCWDTFSLGILLTQLFVLTTYIHTHTHTRSSFFCSIGCRSHTDGARFCFYYTLHITHCTANACSSNHQFVVVIWRFTLTLSSMTVHTSFSFFFSVCTHAHLVTSDLLPATPSQSSLLHHWT